MCLPATIGEDQPRPRTVAVHSMLELFDHVSGRSELMADGLEEGPRNPGHSGSAAKAQANDSDRMTLLIVLLDHDAVTQTGTASIKLSGDCVATTRVSRNPLAASRSRYSACVLSQPPT